MRGRTRWLGIVAVVVVGAGALAWFALGGDDGDDARRPGAAGPDPVAARRSATSACAAFDDVIALVEEDASSDDVLERLDEAQDAGGAAADADAQWIDLSGALSGLEVGLREDDAEATRLSVSVARAACDRVGSGEE